MTNTTGAPPFVLKSASVQFMAIVGDVTCVCPPAASVSIAIVTNQLPHFCCVLAGRPNAPHRERESSCPSANRAAVDVIKQRQHEPRT